MHALHAQHSSSRMFCHDTQYLLDTTTTTHHQKFKLVNDDDDDDDDGYVWKVLNQLATCQKLLPASSSSSSSFFPYLSAFSSIHLRKRWEDRWMDAAPDTHFGSSYYAGF
jgi:hypothetical protein